MPRETKPKHTHYHPTNIPEVVDVDALLAVKLFNHLSWKQYQVLRKTSSSPYYRQEMQREQHVILHDFRSTSLTAVRSTYFPVDQLTD